MRGGHREWMGLLVTGVVACATAGCAIERPGVSASSLNPSPWFNFQLAPAKKDSPNYQRSIARAEHEQVTVKPAIAPVQKEVRWPDWHLPGIRREAQLLPVTNDQPRQKSASLPSEERIDFN